MSADLTARIDELEHKLRSLERELTELRALARAEQQAPVVVQTEAAPPSSQARLKALADAVRRAQAEKDAATLWALAAEAERIAPAADPAWEAYAHRLAEYARAVAGPAKAPAAAAPFPARTTAVAEPTAKPVPRRTAPASKPKPREKTLAELAADWDLLGARGVALAGGVVMLLGIVFFFVLATNRGWIGPLARVSLGAAASALVFVAGIVVHHRYGQLHAALAACGAGIAGGYATLAAATILYGLLPAAGALVAAAGIATAGVVVALAWSSQALAALGFLGAAVSPAALALDEGVSAAGTAFAAVVFAALAVVATRRQWERLLVAGAAVTVVQVVWMVGAADAGDTAAAVVAAVVAALLVGAAAAWQLALRREGLDGLAGSLAATAVAVSLGSAVQLYPDESDQALALLAAGAGLGIAGTLLVRRALDLAYVLGAGALLLAGVATADLLSGTSLAIVFAAQSMLASAIAHRLRERRFLLGAYAYLGVALVEAFAVQSEWADGVASGGEAALGLAASAVAALAAGLLAPAEAARVSRGVLAVLEPLHAWLGRARVDLRALLAAGAFALAAVAVSDLLSGAWLAVTWAAAALPFAVGAWRLAELRLVPFALASAGLAAVQALTVAAPLVPDLYPQLSAGLAGAAAVAAAGLAAAISALLLPAEQRGIARLGSLTGREQELETLLSGRGAVRGALAGTAGALGLGAAGLTLADALGDAGQMLTVILWSVSGLVAVAYAARRDWVVPQLAGGGLLVATLGKAAGYDWPELGANQGAAELLVAGAAVLLAGWLVRALSTREEPLAAVSALAAAVALVSATVAIDQLIERDRAAGAALLVVAGAFAVLAALAQREPRLRNLATAMWVPGLIALLMGEAAIIQSRGIVVAYAATSVGVAWIGSSIAERRLGTAALVLLGSTTFVTLAALTPPTHLLQASESPGRSVWALAACVVAGAAIALLQPPLRSQLGWISAALGLYTASLVILDLAERASTASVQTDFERGHTAVSALWGAVGLGLLVAGLLRDSRPLRLGGLALFGISLAKLFLYDLSALSSVTRAFSFLAVGALLLTGGFFLQKLSQRLEEAKPPASSL